MLMNLNMDIQASISCLNVTMTRLVAALMVFSEVSLTGTCLRRSVTNIVDYPISSLCDTLSEPVLRRGCRDQLKEGIEKHEKIFC